MRPPFFPETEFILNFYQNLENNQSYIFENAKKQCLDIIMKYDKEELLAFVEMNSKSALFFCSNIDKLRLNDSWFDLDVRLESYELLIELLNKYGNNSNQSLRERKDCCRVLFDLINNAYILSYQKTTQS